MEEGRSYGESRKASAGRTCRWGLVWVGERRFLRDESLIPSAKWHQGQQKKSGEQVTSARGGSAAVVCQARVRPGLARDFLPAAGLPERLASGTGRWHLSPGL